MKKFLKIVLAVICGLLIANIITISIISSMFSADSKSQPVIPSSGILKLDLSAVHILEQKDPMESVRSFRNGIEIRTVGIREATLALRIAADSPAVKALYLKTDGAALGIGSVCELRGAIEGFRASGKPVVAYMESPTTGTYFLASAADKIYLGDYDGSEIMINGISSSLVFLKDLLSRFGVNVQLIRHGKYKSAGEMYVKSSPSEENVLQNQEMVNSIWKTYSEKIAADRGLTVGELNALVDGLQLCLPADMVRFGLADDLVDRSALEQKMAVLEGVKDFKDVHMIAFADWARTRVRTNAKAVGKIAVIYADGDIVEGYDPENVDGDRFASYIEKVRMDSTVKAAVLRVNSPGGSVRAAEKIKREMDLLKAVKPVAASFGDYAASGGYWISNGADKIFSNPTTLTGSIGVFSMIPDFSRTYSDFAHVGVYNVKSSKHSDMFAFNRPLDTAEKAYMQKSVEVIYDKFVSMVARGRQMRPEEVDRIAQGRVWTGADALGIGLVDELGGLDDALLWAASAAGNPDLASWQIVSYPEEYTLEQMLMSLFSTEPNQDYGIKSWTNWYEAWMKGRHNYLFAAMPWRIRLD